MTTNHQTDKKTRVLFLQLEFPCWEQARSWGYPGHFGIEEGLVANDAEVLVIPAMHDISSAGPTSWLSRARELCCGKTFDQVWLTLVHVPYEESFLDWVASLAPVRVGCLLESLSYTPEETAQNPLLATRRDYVLRQMRHMTHVVCADECDAEMIERGGRAHAIWWPTMVPRRLVSDHYHRPEVKQAAFFGSLYSAERRQYAQMPELQQLLILPEAPERATNFPATFDELHRLIFSYLSTTLVAEEDVFRQYVDTLRRVRRGAFDAWMTGLKKWGGLVNLPSFGKVYTSRVCEAMGAGVPVLSWDVPNRPRNRALFEPDREILLFQRDQPEQLAEHIRHLQNDTQFARRLTKHARAKVLRYHTLDYRIRQTLDWIQTGCQPDFGDGYVASLSREAQVPAEAATVAPVGPLTAERTPAVPASAPSPAHDGFYVDMFVKDPAWSAAQPNTDEKSRWAKISAFLDVIQTRLAAQGRTGLRILDVGCGRGWLTNLASRYGTCQGVEPVAAVVEHARQLFPNIRFHAGTLQTVLDGSDFQPFDIVLTSEVIEHVPDDEKAGFIARIRQALRPGGFVVLTTPRKEVQAVLQREQAQSNQPVEQWLSEEDVRGLFIGSGFSAIGNARVAYNLRTAAYLPELSEVGPENPDVIGLYQIWAFEAQAIQNANSNSDPGVQPDRASNPSSAGAACSAAGLIKTTVFILTVGDITFEKCQEALARQTHRNFKLDIIRNVSPFSAAAQEMIRRCDTEYFIQVDEDMILYPHAVERMEAIMDSAPDEVGMICFFLYDEDRESNIQGIKIHRTRPMKGVSFKNLKASEMDLLEQMGRRGIQWVAHPDVMGRHGTLYSVETIYHRYKSMYEKDIRTWNLLTWDIRKKAGKYATTGDPLQLFALLGAAHGIINAPLAPDAEKDFKQYNLKSLSLLKQLLTTETPYTIPYEPSRAPKGSGNSPIPFERVQWKQAAQPAKTSDPANDASSSASSAPAPAAGPKPTLKRDKGLSILHTVEFYAPHTGGAEIVVQELSQRLAKRGHRVTVATTAMVERTCSELNGVEIKGFAVEGKLAEGIRGDAAAYQQFLRGHPAEVMMNYAAQQWATDLAFDTLRDTRGRRVNILAPCGYSALVDPRTLRWPQFKGYFEKILPTVLPLYDAAVYHSGMYKDFEFSRNLGLRNGLVIPNGTDDEEFSRPPAIDFRKKYGITTPFIGLCVANFYSGKGQERVIECARAMGRSDFTLVFIGKEGGDLEMLRQRAAGLNIRFLVDIPRADTVAAFRAAHLFLFGSHIEASPLVIIEAKAARLPFISTDCGNVREWRGGVVCAPGEMAGHANRLLDDEGARKQLADDGWREWKERLTWDAVVDQWEDLYLRLHYAKCEPERQPAPGGAIAASSVSVPEFSAPEYEISRDASRNALDALKADALIAASGNRAQFEDYASRHPQDHCGQLWLGLTHWHEGNYAAAWDCFVAAGALGSPQWRVAWYQALVIRDDRSRWGWQNYELARKLVAEVQVAQPDFESATVYHLYLNGYHSQWGQDVLAEDFFAANPVSGGKFVDVGAFDGITLSNTRHFFEQGWTGVCVEPVQANFERCSGLYRGTGVQCVRRAISLQEGVVNISSAGTASSLVLKDTAQPTEPVQCSRLATVLAELGVSRLDYLSIDAEEVDFEVLQSLDFQRHRPGLIVIEYNTNPVEKERISQFLAGQQYVLWHDNVQDLFFRTKESVEPVNFWSRKTLMPKRLAPLGAPAIGAPDPLPARSEPVQGVTAKADRQDLACGVVFSKDRPLQLDATLRSFFRHCQDPAEVRLKVLFAASDAAIGKSYAALAREYPAVEWVSETSFKADLVRLIENSEFVLFLVDDNLFVRDFSVADAVGALRRNPQALGFSLRLGKNTTYCYSLSQAQRTPAFTTVGKGLLCYDWTATEADFGYPIEVSSSIYRLSDLRPLLVGLDYRNPNTLEGELAANAMHFHATHPLLLCPPLSFAFCAPVNKVQRECDNRAGNRSDLSVPALAGLYAAGSRVDVASYDGFTPNACHQEVELRLVRRESSPPRVSIVIPCFKQAHLLPEAVASVLAQTFTDWELIVVNDGSPDDTAAVAGRLAQQNPGRRIRLVSQANQGLAMARNNGIRAATGKYILPLDADDCLEPSMLWKAVAVLEKEPETHIVYTDLLRFGDSNGIFQTGGWTLAKVAGVNQLNYCSLYRREVWERVQGYNPNLAWGYEDWDFWIGAAERGFHARHVPEPLFRYRIKAGSMLTRAIEHDAELRARIILNHPGIYGSEYAEWAQGVLPNAKPCPVPMSSAERAQAERVVATACEQAGAGNGEAATTLLRESMGLLLRDADFAHLAGLQLWQQRELEDAQSAFARAAELSPILIEPRLLRIGVLVDLGRLEEAETAAREVLRMDGLNPDALKLLAGLLANRLQYGEAAQLYYQVLQQNPADVGVMLAMSDCFIGVRDFESARLTCEEALSLAPGNTQATETLARLAKLHRKSAQGGDSRDVDQEQRTKEAATCSSPAVSVVVPCYNQADYLPEAVQSVLEQTYQDFEVIIVNDGSPDDTGRVARQLAAKHPAHTIVVLTKPNGGLADARNAGIRAARGRYILPLDADDILMPDFLSETVGLLDRHPEIAVAYTDLQCFGGSTEVITKGEFGRNLMIENRVAYCSLYRRELWEAVGGYNPNMSVGYEDWDFWVGAVERGLRGQRIPQTLLRYRVKAQSMVGQAMRCHRELIARLVLNHPHSYDEPSRKRAAELLAQSPLPERDVRVPGVSVVIPCWNQARFLPDAVESVRQQTFGDWEIVIVNDGSPDDTSVVAIRLAAQGGRITLIEKPNGGLSSARNAGIRAASGAYVFMLDADDRIRPTMLERTKAALDARERVGFAYSHIQHFGDVDTVYPLPDFDRATLISRDNNVCGSALVRKSMWRQVGGYDEAMREGYEDWNFWLSCVEKGWEGHCIHEPLFCYRKHGQSMLTDANTKRERLLARLVQNHPRLYDTASRAHAEEVLGRTENHAVSRSPERADRTPAVAAPVAEPVATATKPAPPPPTAAPHEAPLGKATVDGSVSTQPRLRVSYLISSILGVTGGNQTLLKQADALQRRGHEVTIVTYTPKPDWFKFNMRVIQVPAQQPMASFVPPSDVVISTYFSNTPELRAVKAPVKVYYAQGDQFIFADSDMPDTPENRHWKELSRASYLQTGMRFVPNSHNLAETVERRYGRKADAILPVCTDQTVFRPLQRSVPGSKFRILIVGPDTRGSQMEPLLFKGIQDIHDGLKLLAERYPHFTAVRMSATGPEIFARFPCEFYIAPDDETKTMLYGTSHLLIYASHYDSCPRPPQEAMAAGCAVICTSTPGAMEYCRDQENSLLIPLRSPQAIADATERLIKDHTLRDRLVQGGLATAREYPREREWNELEALLYRFMEEARRPDPCKNAAREVSKPTGSSASEAAPSRTPSARPGTVVLPLAGQLGWLKNANDFLKKKQLRKAWDAACEAVHARPFHPEGFLLLGEIARAAGDPRRARRCGEQAQKLAPKWKPARKFMNGLGGKGQGNPLDWPFPQSGPDSSPRLTVCVIARNEEKFIERCLASAREVAFELVVVDTGSTDRTVAIAQEQGAKVSHFTWTDDFSAARNAALERATGDWILVLDADEELAPGARETLLKEMATSNTMAYRLPLVDVGREDEGRSYVPRLFRNAPGLFYVGRIHEQVFTSVLVRSQDWGLTIELGQTGLLHYGYTVEMVQSRDKISRNLRLLRQAVEELPNEPNLLMNLGLELTRSGEVAQGIKHYFEALELMSKQNPKEVPPELREVLLTQLSAHLMGSKRFPEVLSVLNSPLAQAGGLTASQHFALGLALMELNRHPDAVGQFRECLAKRDSLALTPINKEIRTGAPSHCLANCLARSGEPAAAEKAFQEALKQSPKSRGVRFDYARFLASRDQQVEALKWLHQLVSEKSDDLAAWVQGGLIALSKPEYTEFAGDWTGEALGQFPNHPVILAQRAEALLLNQDAEGALGCWRQTQIEDQASQLAAMLLCQLLTEGAMRPVALELEPRVSDRFLRWYQRLVGCGASKLVWLAHERIDRLAPVLPTAAKALHAVLAEAGCAPAAQ